MAWSEHSEQVKVIPSDRAPHSPLPSQPLPQDTYVSVRCGGCTSLRSPGGPGEPVPLLLLPPPSDWVPPGSSAPPCGAAGPLLRPGGPGDGSISTSVSVWVPRLTEEGLRVGGSPGGAAALLGRQCINPMPLEAPARGRKRV